MAVSDHKVVDSIRILDADGVQKYAPVTGNIKVTGGYGIDVIKDDYGNLSMGFNTASTQYDDYYVQKYNTIVAGGIYDGHLYTGMPYYMATLEDQNTAEGNVFLLGQACSQVGLFGDYLHPEADAAWLHVFDMCQPDVDC
jgi:hypothetical protein